MRRTKIVATLGPSTDDPAVLAEVVGQGADVLRINLSHGGPEDLLRRLAQVAELRAAREEGAGQGEAPAGPLRPVALLLDTRGPEVRVTPERAGLVLAPGEVLRLRPASASQGGSSPPESATSPGGAALAHASHPALARDVPAGARLLLDDGNLELVALGAEGDDLLLRVVVGGPLRPGAKLVAPEVDLDLPVLLPEDERDLRTGLARGADFVAVSFVRSAADVIAARRLVESLGSGAQVIAKIETRRAVERIDEVLKASDGVMVARGDLGVEFPPEEVPLIQKRLVARAAALGKPVITATEMLESMVSRSRPTRAEAADVANAILDGTDAVMLSAETATGAHPARAVAVMARIAERTDAAFPHEEWLGRHAPQARASVADAVCHATVEAARDLGAAAVVTATESGYTARMVARLRPRARIVAVTPDPGTWRQLALVWGVEPVLMGRVAEGGDLVEAALAAARRAGAVRDGDLVVVTAGLPPGVRGTTNLMRVHTVGDAILRGVGVGRGSATGPAHVALRPSELAGFPTGGVLVARATDREWMEAFRRAAAVITEEAGLTSHAAVVGLALGIPVVVGARGATERLQSGELVTVDGARGLVYRGAARVL
ncbi:MAG: pyruvate kinase [Clostridia bacterium]|nr:pyruvate kinase [Clostridia bacterium]